MDRRRLDQLASAATPSPDEADVAGWRCKAAPALPFRRCNVAAPPADAASDRDRLLAGLAAVRRWYHERGQRLIVQVSSALPGHEAVDGWLADQDLVVEAPVHVLTRDPRPRPELGRAVTVTAGIDEAWATAHGGLVEVDRTRAYGRLLTAFGPRALGASCRIDGHVAGVGFGVLDDGWLGMFGMATAAAHRRRGVASAIVAGLLDAAAERDVHRAYLQVETANAAAIALYRRLGFTISHGYHYRSEPAAP